MKRRAVFDALYAHPDPYRARSYFPEIMRLRRGWDWVRTARYRSVLDIGAGEGHWTAQLCDVSDLVVASDISLEAARRAKVRFPNLLQVVVADLEALSFSPRTFDLVCCMTSLGCLPQSSRARAVDQIREVLVDGGHLLLADAVLPGKMSPGEMPALLRRGFHVERKRAGNARVPLLGRVASAFPKTVGRLYESLSSIADMAPERLAVHTLIWARKT
jgi:SAM-dependent methyltransferase